MNKEFLGTFQLKKILRFLSLNKKKKQKLIYNNTNLSNKIILVRKSELI